MDTSSQVRAYIASLPDTKAGEMKQIHDGILSVSPGCPLEFFDGTADGKVVSNPTIGYGRYTINYANGSTKQAARVGLSANSTGISVYIMGLSDKAFLQETYGPTLGKAKITGYCIRFKSLRDIDLSVLLVAINDALTRTNPSTIGS
jgi:hypothetical protein